jgi:hypothetical protein
MKFLITCKFIFLVLQVKVNNLPSRPTLDTWNLPFVEEYVLRVHFGYKAGVGEQTQCPHYKLPVSSSGFPTVAVKGVLIF